MVADC